MPRVGQDCPVRHPLEMLGGEDPGAAGHGDEDPADGGGLEGRHDLVAVHDRLQGLDRIDLADDDPRAQTPGAHGHSPAAPAVTGDDHGLTRHQEIGRAHDAVPDRLARAVTVVEQVLAAGVVDGHHRQPEHAVRGHGPQAAQAGGRLLAAAEHLRQQIDGVRRAEPRPDRRRRR